MTIIKLDVRTASQIAAGEVVENPSSVVKELLENALDAGANRIRVILQKGGLEEIKVFDDGCGIPAAELRLALERHATSKITGIEDLSRITTLGFRGEALPSIAAVSRTEITTRHKHDDAGSQIYLEGGEEKVFKAAGFPRGTMVTVKDLFFNVPVRRRFLRSIAAEAARATRIVELIALSHPHISFALERDGKTILETSGDGSVLNTILKIFGHRLAPYLLPVQYQEGNYSLAGYVSSPSLSLKSRSHQVFFANRRHVRNRLFREALEKSYARYVTARRYPLAFLFLSLPPEELDVNVHPSKIEVRFRREKELFDFIYKGITDTYKRSGNISTIQTVKQSHKQVPLTLFPLAREDDNALVKESVTGPQVSVSHTEACREKNEERVQDGKDAVTGINYREEPAPIFSREVVILGQLFASLILVQQGDNLLLVDQHAAHERVLWEECLRRRAGERHYLQKALPFPQELTLPLPEDFFSEERLNLLTEVGLGLEQFGNNSFIIRTVPFFLKDIFTAEMLGDVFEELAHTNALAAPEWQEAVLLQLTCKAAVKANKSLSMTEMEALLRQLEQCQNPYYCPHGRPVIVKITRKEMEIKFHRK
ncbi:MAG: DNA mismatch repair endonuclease MutL [Bacillota bacterium]